MPEPDPARIMTFATPKDLGLVRRRQLAKRLLDGSALPVSQVAMHAGYGSLRRFNDDIQRTYGRSPGDLRRQGRAASTAGEIRLRLPARQPFDTAWMLAFLQRRMLEGLELVEEGAYRRRIVDRRGHAHWISMVPGESGLTLRAPADPPSESAGCVSSEGPDSAADFRRSAHVVSPDEILLAYSFSNSECSGNRAA